MPDFPLIPYYAIERSCTDSNAREIERLNESLTNRSVAKAAIINKSLSKLDSI